MIAVLLLLQAVEWAEPVERDGVRVTLRTSALFGAGVLEDARAGRPLREAWRIRFERPGWFLNAPVEAAEYAVSLERGGADYQFILRDGLGRALGFEGFWVSSPGEARPSAELVAVDGAIVVTVVSGGIRVPLRYVPEAAHRVLAKGDETRAGRVVVVSEIGRPTAVAALAREAEKAVDIHAELLGRPAPPGPFVVHLLSTEKSYQDLDKLVTGGRFQRNGALAASLTRRAYVWWVARHDPDSLIDLETPLKIRALVLHELGHLVSYAARPGAAVWPPWLGEGLAEEGTRRALGGDGAAFDLLSRGHWRRAAADGSLPSLEDLLVRKDGYDLNGWYASAYVFGRALVSAGGADLDRLDAERIDTRCASLARDGLGERGEKLWRELGEGLRRGAAPPAPTMGYLDSTSDGWRLTTRPDWQGRVLLPDLRAGPALALETSFAWQPVGTRQADLYLACAPGNDPDRFLKVAVLPKRIVLFRYAAKRWEEWGSRDFQEALPAGDGTRRVWHRLRVDWRGTEEQTLSVVVDEGRRADFRLKEAVDVAGTWCGFGAYDGVVYFKDLRVTSSGK